MVSLHRFTLIAPFSSTFLVFSSDFGFQSKKFNISTYFISLSVTLNVRIWHESVQILKFWIGSCRVLFNQVLQHFETQTPTRGRAFPIRISGIAIVLIYIHILSFPGLSFIPRLLKHYRHSRPVQNQRRRKNFVF